MKKEDFYDKEYSEGTKLKLDIFRKCFREWLPVFIHNRYINRLYIYDFFAGGGKDSVGNFGSPLILLEELRGQDNRICDNLCKNQSKKVVFGFNDANEENVCKLKENVDQFLYDCKNSCSLPMCPFNIYYKNDDFSDLMKNEDTKRILENKNIAKFVLLDQYGFKSITKDIFSFLVNSPKTDFIFFIASSYVKRFANAKVVKKYFEENKLKFDESKPKECHRIICEYYKSLIPPEEKYYMHHFTIQSGSNYYGLIFGTSHSLGMEKFVRVCWQEDKLAGESNCNIDDDFVEGELFYDYPTKKGRVKDEVRKKILSGEIKNNFEGLDFVLMHGCEPKLYVEVAESLINENKITIDGKFNRSSTNIHKVERYNIIIL